MAVAANIVPFAGHITADIDTTKTTLTDGTRVVNFSVGSTSSHFDRTANTWVEEEAIFYNLTAWRKIAENMLNSEGLGKGTRVSGYAKVKNNSYFKDGVTIKTHVYEVVDLSVSLETASVKVTKNPKAEYGAPQGEQTAPFQNAPVQAAPARAQAPAPTPQPVIDEFA